MSKIEEQILYTLNRIADRVEKIALDNVPKPKVEVKPTVKKSIREQMFENSYFGKYPKTRISELYMGEGIIRYTIEHKNHWYSRWHFMMDGSYPRLFSVEELKLLGYIQDVDNNYISKLAVNYRQELEDLGYDFSDKEKELIEATYINGYKEALEYLSNNK